MAEPRVIGPGEVHKCYMSNLTKLTSVLERAFVDYSSRNGSVAQPVRSSTQISKYNGLLLTMPAFSQTEDALVTKLVTVYPENGAKNLPVIQSHVLLFCTKTGSLNCMLNGKALTALRTAHVSAVATKHLSSGRNVLTILGAGTQARSHIQIFTALFTFKEIRIWNRSAAHAKALAQEMENIGIKIHVHLSPEEAVKDADVIITTTLSKEPILMLGWIKTGAHINAVGACDAESQELEPSLMTSASVYVDSREAALVESGDIILSKAEIKAELGEVIAKSLKPAGGGITVFKSLGMAIEDAVTANVIYKSCI